MGHSDLGGSHRPSPIQRKLQAIIFFPFSLVSRAKTALLKICDYDIEDSSLKKNPLCKCFLAGRTSFCLLKLTEGLIILVHRDVKLLS